MGKDIATLVAEMQRNPKGIRFVDAIDVAEHYFGECRRHGSHFVFTMPWAGNPRVNLQRDGSQAKPYQIRQLLAAIDRLENQQ